MRASLSGEEVSLKHINALQIFMGLFADSTFVPKPGSHKAYHCNVKYSNGTFPATICDPQGRITSKQNPLLLLLLITIYTQVSTKQLLIADKGILCSSSKVIRKNKVSCKDSR